MGQNLSPCTSDWDANSLRNHSSDSPSCCIRTRAAVATALTSTSAAPPLSPASFSTIAWRNPVHCALAFRAAVHEWAPGWCACLHSEQYKNSHLEHRAFCATLASCDSHVLVMTYPVQSGLEHGCPKGWSAWLVRTRKSSHCRMYPSVVCSSCPTLADFVSSRTLFMVSCSSVYLHSRYRGHFGMVFPFFKAASKSKRMHEGQKEWLSAQPTLTVGSWRYSGSSL